MEPTIYEVIFITQWPWWLGGICIGLLVPGMYYLLNTPLGVSTGYGSVIKLIKPQTRLVWLNSKTFNDRWGWRIFFLAGIIIGAFLSARLAGRPLVTTEMGRFTALTPGPALASAIWFFVGGLLLGLGSRIAGGCTSGHSIHGLANLHLSSLVATVFFLFFGAVTVWHVGRFVLGVM